MKFNRRHSVFGITLKELGKGAIGLVLFPLFLCVGVLFPIWFLGRLVWSVLTGDDLFDL